MKTRKNAVRRHEATDPNPMTLPVKFQKPPTLAEQIARHMASTQRWQEAHADESPEEAHDFGDDNEDEPQSIHELVFDPELNQELTRYEKAALDRSRARFDAQLKAKIERDRAARAAADEAERRILEKAGSTGRPTKKVNKQISEDSED